MTLDLARRIELTFDTGIFKLQNTKSILYSTEYRVLSNKRPGRLFQKHEKMGTIIRGVRLIEWVLISKKSNIFKLTFFQYSDFALKNVDYNNKSLITS